MSHPLAVALRPVQPDDLPLFFQHQQDPEAQRQAAFTPPDPSDRAAFDRHWVKISSNPQITLRTILHKGAVVGHLASFPQDGELELTYWLDRAAWNRGIATEALRLFLLEIPTRPLYARTAHDNLPSQRVLRKLGFALHATDRYHAHARGGEIEEMIFVLR
jgi:RimJ/RimL family protein N-acetyltransferase